MTDASQVVGCGRNLVAPRADSWKTEERKPGNYGKNCVKTPANPGG